MFSGYGGATSAATNIKRYGLDTKRRCVYRRVEIHLSVVVMAGGSGHWVRCSTNNRRMTNASAVSLESLGVKQLTGAIPAAASPSDQREHLGAHVWGLRAEGAQTSQVSSRRCESSWAGSGRPRWSHTGPRICFGATQVNAVGRLSDLRDVLEVSAKSQRGKLPTPLRESVRSHGESQAISS